MVSMGGGQSSSHLQSDVFPGMFNNVFEGGSAQGKAYAPGKEIGEELKKMLMGGYKAEYSPAEQQFLTDIKAQTQGESAVKGLGESSEAGLAQKLAPAMLGLQQQKMGGLLELGGLAMPQIVSGMRTSGKSSSGGVSY